MKKNKIKNKIIILFLALFSLQGFSQTGGYVGINTSNPVGTLDVNGSPDDSSKLDAIILPRLTAVQLNSKTYTTAQKGSLVYVVETFPTGTVPGIQTVNVKEVGTYEFNGTVWKLFHEPLYDVVNRGNYSPRYISFTGDAITKQGDLISALGFNENTYSNYWGNMNQNHTGYYNIGFGYNVMDILSTGGSNVSIGHYSSHKLTSGIGNVVYGTNAATNLSTGSYNCFIGDNSGYLASLANVNVALGNNSLYNIVSGYKNIAIGQSAGNQITTGSYNTVIGQVAGPHIDTNIKNTMIGAQSGSYIKGNNNVFIGVAAGRSNSISSIENVSNRLVIHSNASFVPNTNISSETTSDLSSSYTNGLIIGDFLDRWIQFNGRFILNASYNIGDSSFSKNVVAKPDGTVGLADMVVVPAPPSSGTYILKSVNGVLQWIP